MTRLKLNLNAVAVFYFALFAASSALDGAFGLFRFPPRGPGRLWVAAAGAAIGITAGVTVALLNLLALRFSPSLRSLSRSFERLIGKPGMAEAFLLAIYSAVGEEFLFRGVLQPHLGWIATSLIFGLLHTGPERKFIAWTVYAVLCGLLFGALYDLTGDLLCPVAAHFVVNFLSLRWTPGLRRRPARTEDARTG